MTAETATPPAREIHDAAHAAGAEAHANATAQGASPADALRAFDVAASAYLAGQPIPPHHAASKAAPAAPLVTNHQDMTRLAALALAVHEQTARLADRLVSLRNAIDRAETYGGPGLAAEAFAALRNFQAQLDDTDRAAYAVLAHATAAHGYY